MSLRISSVVVKTVVCLTFASLPLASNAADEYPSRAIRFVVPFAAGGGIDFIARILSAKLAESMKVSIIVDNRGGGSAVIGTQIVANATPDGYTLLTVNPNFAVNPAIIGKLPYRTPEDFAPVASFISYPMVLGVRSSLGVSSVKEVIDAAKQNPRKLMFAVSGIGSTGALAVGLLEQYANVKFTYVTYKGIGPATADVAVGHVDLVFTGLSQLMPHVQTGRIKLLGTTGLARAPSAPEIRTLDEQGLKGFEALVWWGLVAPAGTPRRIVAKLNREVAHAAVDPLVIKRLHIVGGSLHVGTPEDFGSLIRSEMKKWGKIIQETNMNPR